jgi:hypothetical protein
MSSMGYREGAAMSSKKARYRDCIVTFFDILGYSELVLRGKDPAQVLQVLKEAKYHSKEDDELQALYETSFVNFSESVVRIVPLDSKANEPGRRVGLLFHELLGLVHVQLELSALGIPIRGGVTAGSIYYDGEHLFGPALVAAYSLESKVAQHPRIVVDPGLLRRAEKDRSLGATHHSVEQDRDYIFSLLKEDSDGIWFVDYLRGARDEVDDPPCGYVDFLVAHKAFISKAIADIRDLNSVAQKYAWLISYHNSAVSELNAAAVKEQCGRTIGDLSIEIGNIPWMVRGL